MPRRRTAKRPQPLFPSSKPGVPLRTVFANPPAEYRGAPFWSWNGRLEPNLLRRQIDGFAAMGFGGFHMHARTGLADEYLGPEFMSAVRLSVEYAAKQGLRAWLYDEDRWPSGFAGGLVTQDPRFRQRRLRWTRSPSADARLLAVYDVTLTSGRLLRYRRLPGASAPRSPKGQRWYACATVAPSDPWFNQQCYVDVFQREAIEAFLRVTHDRYASHVGGAFGGTIPAIFTDEPHFLKKPTFRLATDEYDLELPWTDDLPETFAARHGFDLLDHLPELFWNLPEDAPSRARYLWHDHTAERFATSFGDAIASRCAQLGLRLTGHMLSEATLFGQTRAVGEVMRAMRSFHLPGIDLLEDKLELTTAKQAQSLARQQARDGVVSELYGVTGWHLDFAGHKRQGDWQAATGVTVRVPHLAWLTMAGEAKRDYPGAIDYHSPWYREYRVVEDHFARLNTVLTRGRPLVRVAVIHPIESFWLCFGCLEQNAAEMRERERAFADITAWLCHGLIDFDFVAESLLEPATVPAGARGKPTFTVGRMRYEAVVVPALRTIRRRTLQRLADFAAAGGRVVFAGAPPTLVDARPSPAAGRLAKDCISAPFTERAILSALEPVRDVAARLPDGGAPTTLVHQLRADGRDRLLFVANVDRHRSAPAVTLRTRGAWDITLLDTSDGRMRQLAGTVSRGMTSFSYDFPAHGHLLVALSPRSKRSDRQRHSSDGPRRLVECGRLTEPIGFELDEPNVLPLTQAEWRLNDLPWQPREELLRVDNLARTAVGLPPRGGRDVQPWADSGDRSVAATLSLRFAIRCDVPVESPRLAMEHLGEARLTLDRKPVDARPDGGWWVDESIQTLVLPRLSAGDHLLEISLPLSRRTNVEWVYLLGRFGVEVAGRNARIVKLSTRIEFGDWTRQGLPFYVGNLTYRCSPPARSGADEPCVLEVAHFRNPLIVVSADGRRVGPIAFAPYRIELPANTREIGLTAFGHRHNAFGPIHHTNEQLSWIGPASWRSTGAAFSYEYHLKPMGVLAAPILYRNGS